MNTIVPVNEKVITAIHSLYQEDSGYKKFFDSLSERVNDSTVTPLTRISNITGFDQPQTVLFCRKLAETGAGEFIVGRKGNKSRMVWNFGLKSLAKVAQGVASDLENVHNEPSDLEAEFNEHDAHMMKELGDDDRMQEQQESPIGGQFQAILDAKTTLSNILGIPVFSIEIRISL